MPRSGRVKPLKRRSAIQLDLDDLHTTPKKGDKNADTTTHSKKEDRENPFAFKVLSETQTKDLLELDVDEVQRKLVEILKLPHHDTDMLEASVLDYYVGILWWAKEQGYSVAQVSALFTAADIIINNIKEKQMSILDNLREFKEMMSGIGQLDCEAPGGLDCFETSQAKAIVDYFHQTLFQHYRMFSYVFTHTQAEEVIGLDLTCQLAKPADIPWPPPLDEGLPKDVWEKYIKTPPQTPVPVEGEKDDAEAERLKQEAQAESEADLLRENELLSELSLEEIQQVVEAATKDIFNNLNAEMAAKLRERENTILTRINKIHKVAT